MKKVMMKMRIVMMIKLQMVCSTKMKNVSNDSNI